MNVSRGLLGAVLVGSALLLLGTQGAQAEPVSRERPASCREPIAWLTPTDEALRQPEGSRSADETGVVLLRESLRSVDAHGQGCLVLHYVERAKTAAGAASLARTLVQYRKQDQRVHLLLAQSIQPDGTRTALGEDAAFLQSPQPDADSAIYADVGQLVLVFPHVVPQTVTEWVVAIEDSAPHLADEYIGQLDFAGAWSVARQRHVLQLAPPLADRLKVVPVGAGVPEARRQALPGGALRLTWDATGAEGRRAEANQPPVEQVGPAIWLTTLADWNALGRWYGGLLQGRDSLGPALEAQVDAWLKPLAGRSERIAALFTRVARDVRYTGLEFGSSGYQPHAPAEVWANRYGDCKDKANLLRVLLERAGIPAHLALLNTAHAGRIEPAAPSQAQFDHAILAIPEPGGGYLFCDPTISFGRPGLLSQVDADRDALVLEPTGPRLVHIPPSDAGELRFGFELEGSPQGGLAGWFELQATEYLGALYAERFASQSRSELRGHTQEWLLGFYPGAELIDVEVPPAERFAGVQQLRAYFMVAAADGGDGERASLRFPWDGELFPRLDEARERVTPFWQWIKTYRLEATIRLPAGHEAVDLPRPFAVESPACKAEASWQVQAGTVTARAVYRTPQATVGTASYGLLFNAVRSLQAWLDKPISVRVRPGTPPEEEPASAAAAPAPLADFPLMPSAEGQLDLADHRYPPETHAAQRKEALLQVLQWFPADRPAAFRARIGLAELELAKSPKDARVLGQVRQLVSGARGKVEPELLAWGEFLWAGWQAEAGKKEAAFTLFARLAADPELSPHRRAWSTVRAGELALEQSPAKAERLLREEPDRFADAAPRHHQLLALALVRQGKAAELQPILRTLFERTPERVPRVWQALVAAGREMLAAGQPDQARALAATLARVAGAAGVDPARAAEVEALQQELQSFGVHQAIATALRSRLAQHPPAWWTAAAAASKPGTQQELLATVVALEDSGPVEEFLRQSVVLLTRFPPDPEHFSVRLWKVLAFLEDLPDEELFAAVAGWCGQLPLSDPYHWEAELTQLRHLANRGDHAAALAAGERLVADPQLPPLFQDASWRQLGTIHEAMGAWPRALEAYRKLEANPTRYRRSWDGLLRAVFVNLELGRRDEALRLLGLLQQHRAAALEESGSADQLTRLLALVESGQAGTFWERQARWWPAWERLELRMGLTPLPGGVEVPWVPDLTGLGEELGAALEAKNRGEVLRIFRLLIHAARWEPGMAVEWSSALAFLGRLAPELVGDARQLALELLVDLRAPDPETVRGARVMQAAHLLDSDRAAEARAIAIAYLGEFKELDARGQAMRNLLAMAAIRGQRDLEPAAQALEEALASPGGSKDRLQAVELLAQLLIQLGRPEATTALLERELKHPEIRKDDKATRALGARLRAVLADQLRDRRFDPAVARWVQRVLPPWYDLAQPSSLADFTDLDAALETPPRELSRPERAKLGLLVLQDRTQPRPRREAALGLALGSLSGLAVRHSELDALYRSLYDDRDFEEGLRARWFWWHVVDTAQAERGPELERLAAHDLFKQLNEGARGFVAHYRQYLGRDRNSAAALQAYLEELLAGPVDNIQAKLLYRAFRRLCSLGALAPAQAIYERTAALQLVGEKTDQRATLRLELLKRLQHARRHAPRQAKLRQLVLEGIPEAETRAPAAAADLVGEDRAEDLLEPAAARRARLSQVKLGADTLADPDFWVDLAADVERDLGRRGLSVRVLQTLVAEAPDDEARADEVTLSFTALDIDDPEQRAVLLATYAPYRDPAQHPRTAAALRYLDARLALRTGNEQELQAALAAMTDPEGRDERVTQVRLIDSVRRQDGAGARRLLASLSSQALLDRNGIPARLAALALAGMKEEEALVREGARKQLGLLVLAAWASPSLYAAGRALMLEQALGEPGLLPAGWLAAQLRLLRAPLAVNELAIREARERGDWAGVLKLAGEMLAARPTNYSFYRVKAEALIQLGRPAEAIPALETYVRYCKDEGDYPEGVRRLAELRPGSGR